MSEARHSSDNSRFRPGYIRTYRTLANEELSANRIGMGSNFSGPLFACSKLDPSPTATSGVAASAFCLEKKSFLEMLSYGLQFQLGSIVMMLFDPLTKAMLARYGGVGAVGYFEMASQLVTRVRALIVSANQVVVPLIASVYQHDVRHLEKIFNFSMELLFLVIGPIFALLILWSPLISELWLGTRDEKFTAYVTILSIAWGFNVIAGPAYFANQGTGKIGWNSASHVWIGVANVLLGWSLGKIFGAWGCSLLWPLRL